MKSKNFTLIELLVTISVLAVLATLLIPSLKKSLNVAMKSKCLSQLKVIGVALNHYTSDNEEFFPVSSGSQANWVGKLGTRNPRRLDASRRYLNQYLGEFKRGDEVLFSQCPSDLNQGNLPGYEADGTTYFANVNRRGKLALRTSSIKTFNVRNLSITVALGTFASYRVTHRNGIGIPDDAWFHSKVGEPMFNLLFADGSARRLWLEYKHNLNNPSSTHEYKYLTN